MDKSVKELAQNLSRVRTQSNINYAYALGCNDSLEKLLQILEEVAQDTQEFGIAFLRDTIGKMREEIRHGQGRFAKQAADLLCMQQLITNDKFGELLSKVAAKQAQQSTLILPTHYRR